MDKFAVDLEKVLDDFEYNEGREESVIPSVIKNISSHNSQKRPKPPASVYRRPTFEPINLSDADFSAASISTSDNYIKNKEEYSVNNNTVYNEPFITSNDSIPEKKRNDVIPYNESTNNCSTNENVNKSVEVHDIEECDDITEGIDKEPNYSDGTPDLLDSNTLKPNQSNSSYAEDPNLSSQLPDITSVSNILLSPSLALPIDENQPAFDLIKPTAVQQVSFDEKLPPIVDIGIIVKENIPDIKVKQPITFVSVDNDDISESELEEYLNKLEINDNIVDFNVEEADRGSSNDFTEIATVATSSEEQIVDICDQPVSVELSKNIIVEDTPVIEKEERKELIEVFPKEEEIVITQVNESTDSFESKKDSEPNDEILQTMCENITVTGTKASCIDNLEIISTQITEYKNTEVNISNEIIEKKDENLTLESSVENESSNPYENKQLEDSDKIVQSTSNVEDLDINSNQENDLLEVQQSQEESKPCRPKSLALESRTVVECDESPTPTNTVANNSCGPNSPMEKLGKFPPFWVPDTESDYCMQCQNKFTVIRRRHHCRACGLVLCSKCCNLKAPLEYLDYVEARVCQRCFNIIYRVSLEDGRYNLGRQPNPNNPMEYCSTIPPLQQAASTINKPPPSVLVPTGVLKREGRAKSDVPKQVMFSDGIRPGGDLTELDGTSESRIFPRGGTRRLATPPGGNKTKLDAIVKRPLDPSTQSFIPANSTLPPLVLNENGQLLFSDETPKITDEPIKFAINYNLFVSVKKIKLDCCVNRLCWSVCSEGLACVGQDEVAIILECLPDELHPPQDLFNLINVLYQEASKGTTTVSEMCFTPSTSNTLFGSKDHGGFLYIRPTFQCTTNLLLPSQPYLIAILVHRWETPWARLFPLRLVLRLGAEYRYYPCPLVSIRNRKPLYTDIGHTVMEVLVDFRKYSYSLATVRGLLIHMEDRQTTILFPRNRYDQVVRALNNSNESVLAFGANLSLKADSHLVCIQGEDENTYHTQAINIHNKPRRVTGASFVVFKGALKPTGLSGKSSIMEDGLMVHLLSDSMTALRTALREMQDYTISCGPNDEETVYLQWTDDDMNFNIGVKSCIDGRQLDGIPSIRVHNGTDYPGNHKIIRWTEVFILQNEEGRRAADPPDISRVSESLAKATCMALVPDLDSLSAANLTVLAIRATIHPECVGYEAGSCSVKLPSIYMKHLDEELVPVIHQAALASQDTPVVLELIFRVMNHP